MDTTTAFLNVRKSLIAAMALQPEEGRLYVTGMALSVRQLDGSAVRYQFQHVAGGTMRAVRTELEGLTEVQRTVTPLGTNVVANDYLRAMLVEVLA